MPVCTHIHKIANDSFKLLYTCSKQKKSFLQNDFCGGSRTTEMPKQKKYKLVSRSGGDSALPQKDNNKLILSNKWRR